MPAYGLSNGLLRKNNSTLPSINSPERIVMSRWVCRGGGSILKSEMLFIRVRKLRAASSFTAVS